MVKDNRIDLYIHQAAPFAQPILNKLRENVHKSCPAVEETIKWGFPNFVYQKTILCSMAAFKAHCSFGFWLAPAMAMHDPSLNTNKSAMGDYGQLKSIHDLPKQKVFSAHVKLAMSLIEKGIKNPVKSAKSTRALVVPEYFIFELNNCPQAKTNFNKMSPSHQKEYIDWIRDAKTEATRKKRMATAMEWISEAKGRNWKYQ